jgi:hypothetical protein
VIDTGTVPNKYLCREYFDPEFIKSPAFIWKTLVITAVSCLPLYFIKFLRSVISHNLEFLEAKINYTIYHSKGKKELVLVFSTVLRK